MKSNPQIVVKPLTSLIADPSEMRGDQAEQVAEHRQQKRKVRCERARAGKSGTFINCYFLSITHCGHCMIHIVHEELEPFRLNNCSCETCDTSETVHDFVGLYDGIKEYEILPLEDHPDSVVVIIHDGQPSMEHFQIYPIELNKVVPRNCDKPLHRAIWKVTEEVKRRRAQ